MIPTPTEINVFQAVAQEESFSRAANKLGVSQPALSLAVRRLEENLGAMLFIRHKRGVSLTQAGEKFYLRSKNLLDSWVNIQQETIAYQKQVQGEIRLGCPITVGLYLREVLPHLLDQYPQLTFNLIHDSSHEITNAVVNAKIDIGIVSHPFRHPGLIIQKLKSTEITFWKGVGSRKIQDTQSDKLVIICAPNFHATTILLKRWKKHYPPSARLLTSTSLEIVADLTAGGSGIGILPSCFVQSLYQHRLEKLSDVPVYHDNLYLIYRKESREVAAVNVVNIAIKKFVEECQK